jgi:hypothetical protein
LAGKLIPVFARRQRVFDAAVAKRRYRQDVVDFLNRLMKK